MIKPDYARLNGELSSNTNSSDSEICWREFLIANYNFMEYCSKRVKEDEVAELLKSLQNWTAKREFKVYREHDNINGKWVEKPINLGDIVFVEFGINFSNEVSYAHPAVVLENINDSILVCPSSSNNVKIREAYHPIDNKESKSLYRKVKQENGFDNVCVLELDKIRVINKSRIIRVQGRLNENINEENSLFNEIKHRIFQKYFPVQYLINQGLIEENNKLQNRIMELENLVK